MFIYVLRIILYIYLLIELIDKNGGQRGVRLQYTYRYNIDTIWFRCNVAKLNHYILE